MHKECSAAQQKPSFRPDSQELEEGEGVVCVRKRVTSDCIGIRSDLIFITGFVSAKNIFIWLSLVFPSFIF